MMHRKLTKQQLTDRSLSMKQAYRLTDNELQKAQIATASFLSGRFFVPGSMNREDVVFFYGVGRDNRMLAPTYIPKSMNSGSGQVEFAIMAKNLGLDLSKTNPIDNVYLAHFYNSFAAAPASSASTPAEIRMGARQYQGALQESLTNVAHGADLFAKNISPVSQEEYLQYLNTVMHELETKNTFGNMFVERQYVFDVLSMVSEECAKIQKQQLASGGEIGR